MVYVLPPGVRNPAPPQVETSPDGKLRATVWPRGAGVLLEADFSNDPTPAQPATPGSPAQPATPGSPAVPATPGSPEQVLRRNLLSRPVSGVVGIWGTGGAGSPVLSQEAGFRRVTWGASSGTVTGGMTYNNVAAASADPGLQLVAGDTRTVSLRARCSRAQTVRLIVNFIRTNGTSVSAGETAINLEAGVWTEFVHTTAAAPADVDRMTVLIYSRSPGTEWLAGDTLDVEDGVMMVAGSASPTPRFTGSSPASGDKRYRWTGTPGASTSEEYIPAVPATPYVPAVPPTPYVPAVPARPAVPAKPGGPEPHLVEFYRQRGDELVPVRSGWPAHSPGGYAEAFDAEAPLGDVVSWVAVPRYRSADPTGEAAPACQPVALALPGISVDLGDVWLKSLADPALSMLLEVANDPEEPTEGQLSLQQPRNSPYPTGAYGRRALPAREYVLRTRTTDDKRRLLALLDSGVLLLQTATVAGVDDMYVLAGSAAMRYTVGGFDPTRETTVSLQPVRRPTPLDAPLLIPGRSYAEVGVLAPTYAEGEAIWPTYRDVWQP